VSRAPPVRPGQKQIFPSPPAPPGALDPKYVVTGRIFVCIFRIGRSRRYSNGRNFFVARALEPYERPPVIVAVKQKLGAHFSQYSPQIRAIDEAPKKTPCRTERRVLDQHNAKASTRLFERLGEPRELPLAKPPGCQERSGRHASRKRDQRHVGATADKWKALESVIAAHVIGPELPR